MTQPKNKKLYDEVKQEIYKKYPQHSAYRSALLVKEYKKRGGQYEDKRNKNEGLNVWFKEEWKNQRGETGYKYKSDVYRPTKRITRDTPATINELTTKQIETARREKLLTGRVKRFDK